MKAWPLACLAIATLSLAACSDAKDKESQPDVSTAPPDTKTAKDSKDSPENTPLGPEAQEEALSIREAADKAAALVEADAAAAQTGQ